MGINKQQQFSQGSLQDFTDCERRFYHRYQMRLAWPAAEIEPIAEHERLQKLGSEFHLLVQQSISRVPEGKVESRAAEDQDLALWWKRYQGLGIAKMEGEISSEIVLRTRLGDALLVAKYDLLYLSPDGEAVIYDWKTSKRKPDRFELASRWQSILYPYLLAACADEIWPGKNISPDDIKMIYWFANFPEDTVELSYSSDLHGDHEKAILAQIAEIGARSGIDDFPLTTDESRCSYCVYRSLCNRGISAGEASLEMETDNLEGFDLDIDQIQEIEL